MLKWQYFLGALSLLIVLSNALPVVPKEPAVNLEEELLEDVSGIIPIYQAY